MSDLKEIVDRDILINELREELAEAKSEIARLKEQFFELSNSMGLSEYGLFSVKNCLKELTAERAKSARLVEALKNIINYAKPDDRHHGLAHQNNFLGLSVVIKWAREALKDHGIGRIK